MVSGQWPTGDRRRSMKWWGLPAVVLAFSLGGVLFTLVASDYAASFTLPSSIELLTERPSTFLLHPLWGPGVLSALAYALSCGLASRLINDDLSQARQATAMLVGGYIGAAVFVVVGTLERLGGPGLAVWSLVGAAVFCGCSRWKELRFGWRAFTILNIVSISLAPLQQTAMSKASFAASATGLVMAFGWLRPDSKRLIEPALPPGAD